MGDGDDAHPWVAVGCAVGGELLEVRRDGREAGLLVELAAGCSLDVLVGPTKPPGSAQWSWNGSPARRTSMISSRPARTVKTARSTVTANGGKPPGS